MRVNGRIFFKCVILSFVAAFLISNAYADVTCEGKISAIYKWANTQAISVKINTSSGETNWIQMPTKSDESMALMAFAAGKVVTLRWGDNVSYNQCINGWAHNTVLAGWWMITAQ